MSPSLRRSFTLLLAFASFAIPSTSALAADPTFTPGGATAWIQAFPPTQYASTSTSLVGDVNGDRRADAVVNFSGYWYVALSTGTGFSPYTLWLSSFGAPVAPPGIPPISLLADVSGDGRADAVVIENDTWKVAKANNPGPGFAAPATYVTGFGAPTSRKTVNMLGDVNKDGMADAVSRVEGTWTVALAQRLPQPAFIKSASKWGQYIGDGANAENILLGDVTGDGRADAVWQENARWLAAPSTGTRFGQSAGQSFELSSLLGTTKPILADVNADGMSDGISISGTGVWTVALASMNGTVPSFSSPNYWSKGTPPPGGVTTATQFFAPDLNGPPAPGLLGDADALTVKDGTWYGSTVPSIPDQIKNNTAGWTSVLDDNFNPGTSLDTNTWNDQRYDYWLKTRPMGAPFSIPYNSHEDAPYASANNTVSEGNLVQKIRKTTVNGVDTYTAAMVNTLGKITGTGAYAKIPGTNTNTGKRLTGGYVEANIKIPPCATVGCWPAFWLVPAPPETATPTTWQTSPTGVVSGWPPELDIVEVFPHIPGNRAYYNSHWGSQNVYNEALNDLHSLVVAPATSTTPVIDADLTGRFHKYGMLWTSTYIQFFVDGVAGPKFDNPAAVPNQLMYVIISLQRMGDYKLNPQDPSSPTVHFPTPDGVEMLTDYVKILRFNG